MRPRSLVLALLATLPALWAPARRAAACEPGPNHSAAYVEDDAPECLVLGVQGDYEGAFLSVTNDCTVEVTLSGGEDCPRCAEPVLIAPAATVAYLVEDGEAEGRRTVEWADGSTVGTIAIDVSYRDNSGACDDSEASQGCAVGAAGAPGSGAGLLLAACLVAARARRRAAARVGPTPVGPTPVGPVGPTPVGPVGPTRVGPPNP